MAKPTSLLRENPLPVDCEQAPVEGGVLVEHFHGRALDFVLDAARYLAAVQFLYVDDVRDVSDIDRIRSSGHDGLIRSGHFNAAV